MGKNSKSNSKHCGIKVIINLLYFASYVTGLCICAFFRCCWFFVFVGAVSTGPTIFLLYCWPNSYLFLSLCPDGFQGTGLISLGLYIPKLTLFLILARVNQELFLKSLTQFWSFAFSHVSSDFIICRQNDRG